jgi:hypothetical protein
MTRAKTQPRKFKLRYVVEPWDKAPAGKSTKTADGRVRASGDRYGYADDLFIISMSSVGTKSWLLLDTRAPETFTRPTIAQLTEVRDYLNHLIENHTSEFPK